MTKCIVKFYGITLNKPNQIIVTIRS